MGWVDPWVGSRFFQFLVGWVGSTIAKVLKFEMTTLMHLKHGWIRFDFTKQLNLILRPI